MQRRTKIVCTLGPATDSDDVLERLIVAGANVVRLNFSHGNSFDHIRRAYQVRSIAQRLGKYVAILADLQGPKIRISRFSQGQITLRAGDSFVLDAEHDSQSGTKDRVGIDYKELPEDVEAGDTLLLDDGRIVFKVEAVEGSEIRCTTVVGGVLSNNKGLNRQGGGLSAPALTDKDLEDIKVAAEMAVDYLAVSFPRSAEDMHQARQALAEAGTEADLVAKIERAEAVADDEVLEGIILASDAVMVARGDLGVEIGDAQLIGTQKKIISKARSLDRGVIVATQMMESMISSCLPTRAEVFDVANAVLDGTDAVMLSAETATGEFPVETVEAMGRVIVGAELHPQSQLSNHRLNQDFQHIDESIAMGTMYCANHLAGVKAIVCMTESGRTPKIMSRINSHLPIYAFSSNEKSLTRLALYRGIQAVAFSPENTFGDEANQLAIDLLGERNDIREGDLVILTKGNSIGDYGGTNTMKIVEVDRATK
ncbi:pyruvate kinase [Pseudoteredinibacter isoporae]|uniref:Pyruvate kinase n=1 Tax=Pseudoteredinibacter isoporae TaxID=570281 RepID=A0A7X0MYY9_9GAMM|nr:pyruvate kinase [Pseudoteredinibacter isoporae]MBB6522587.1 pyruvate kinase [Pseudoteredinibacter isoporae]NHO88117.1 pyruvate kinase [Pseudoteredinibacter isoporae]NIB23552.1 pyruvate kinase [Pseudoteredinibacter isoporae]